MDQQKVLNCFTDGSCFNNGYKNAVAAWACVWPDYQEYDASQKLSRSELHTNNRAEYSGCLNAFRTAAIIDSTYQKPLIIHTDSMLLINSMTKWIRGWKSNGWKTKTKEDVKNVDLLKQIDSEMSMRRATIFRYVKAHTNKTDWASIYNDKADRLAKQACSQQNITEPALSALSTPSQSQLNIKKELKDNSLSFEEIKETKGRTVNLCYPKQTKITAFFGRSK